MEREELSRWMIECNESLILCHHMPSHVLTPDFSRCSYDQEAHVIRVLNDSINRAYNVVLLRNRANI